MNDLVYKVNKKKKTVECTVQKCRNDFMRVTDKLLSQYPEHIRYFYGFISTYYCNKLIRDEYSSVAKCSPHDKFNEAYGMDVARTRAIIKRERAFNNALEAIYNDIQVLCDINISIGREHIIEKHLDNYNCLISSGMTLDQINDICGDECEGMCEYNDYTPHSCSLCGDTLLNYLDDVEYEKNESDWKTTTLSSGKKVEICPRCSKAIKNLSSLN
jgi:hypothetical protein